MKLFDCFKNISKFNFNSTSIANSNMNWNAKEIGATNISITDSTILFEDIFYNRYKTIDYKKWVFNENLEFWHLRLGKFSKIFTFNISDLNNIILIKEHKCNNDLYEGKIIVKKNVIEFNIFITSIRKNEHIIYNYY